jgi:hypothetical protein
LRASVLLGKLDPKLAYLAKQSALVHAKLARSSEPVASVTPESVADGLDFRSLDRIDHATPMFRVGRAGHQLRGQVPEVHLTLVQKHECVLNDVLQLSDIAGIVMGAQDSDNIRTDSRNVLVLHGIEERNEVLHERGDILSPLAKRWHFDLHDLDAVVEILAKPTGYGERR